MKGVPLISMVTFDSKMEEIFCLKIQANIMRNIFKIKRMADKNVIVASGLNLISLISIKEEKNPSLSEIKQLRDIHSGEIFDFTIKNEREIF